MSLLHKIACALTGVAGLLAAGVAGHWLGTASAPDRVLAHAYAGVWADSDTSWSATPPHVWLSGLAEGNQPFGRELQVGDVLTITGKGGRPEAVQVLMLDLVSGERVGLPGTRFQLVTGRSRSAGTASGRLMRFLFSAGPAEATVPPTRADRVL